MTQKMICLYKVLGTFSLKPTRDVFMVSNGNYGSCLKARLRNLIYLVFLALFGRAKGLKMDFL